MFSKTLLRIAFVLLSTIIFFSCEKEPVLEEEPLAENLHFFDLESYRYKDALRARFFDPEYLTRGADKNKGVNSSIAFRSEELLEELGRIQYIMGFQDSLMNYIPSLTERFGFPAWYYTLATNDGKFWFIPLFEEESSKTEAVLVIKVGDSLYDFRLIPRYEAETPVFTQVYAYNFYTSLNLFAIFDQWAFDYLDANWLSWYEEHADSLDQIIPREWCIEYQCLPHIMNGGGPPSGGGSPGPIVAIGPRGGPCPEGYDAFPFFYECEGPSFGFGFGTFTGWGLTGYYEGDIHQGGNSNWASGAGGSNHNNNPPNWWDENSLCLMDEELGDGISSNSISELMNILPLNDRIRLRQLVEINQYMRLECTQTGELWNNPELQGIVYHFLQGEGWSPAALETVNLVLDSGGSELNSSELPSMLDATEAFLEEYSFDQDAIRAVELAIKTDLAGVLDNLFSPVSLQLLTQYIGDCCPEGIDDYDGGRMHRKGSTMQKSCRMRS